MVPRITDAHLPGQRRELMHDHIGLGGRHRLGDGIGVERGGHDRARTRLRTRSCFDAVLVNATT